MIDDTVRKLMGRVAKGLPIVVLGAAPFVLSGCWCTCPDWREVRVISPPAAEDGGLGAEADCYTVCENAAPEYYADYVARCREVPEGLECTYGHHSSCGRRPERPYVATAPETSPEPRRRWLTEMAILELASVPAFYELADALTRLGAPTAFVDRARQSARDEVEHARMAFALARREGGPVELRVKAHRAQDSGLRELAIHNAREGCIGEAYGALEAAWQAQHVGDECTRGVFATIARDEARHAQLSLEIDSWARGLLEEAALPALDAARADAARELRANLSSRAAPRGLGLPTSLEAEALLAMVA